MDSDYDECLSEGSNSLNDDQINNTIETTAKSIEEEVPAILMEGNVEDSQISVEEECPKILQPAFSDIFPLFANMLDIQSFMTLSRASKEMYAKCMDDDRIKLNVKEKGLSARMTNGAPQLEFCSYRGRRDVDSYLGNLRRLKFDISLSNFSFKYSTFDPQAVIATRNYLKEIGVKSIDRLELDRHFNGWQEIVPFMEEFGVQHASVSGTIPEDTLSSILQLNMHSFDYSGEISANTLLNVSSPIPKMVFSNMQRTKKDVFTQLLWKIQTGPLENLTLNWSAVNISSFNTLSRNYDGALPADRPLVFSKVEDIERFYWFLHWHGGVTKCVAKGFEEEYYQRCLWRYRNRDNRYYNEDYFDDCFEESDEGKTIEITKCDPSNYPAVIRPKELAFKELDEKRDRVICSSANFHSYFEGKRIMDSSIYPLPEERPLLFKGTRSSYWNFKEDGVLEHFELVNIKVYYRAFDTNNRDFPSYCDNVALAKYFFQRKLKEGVYGHVECTEEQFNSWLEEYKTLPYDHIDPLPEDRPLIFGKPDGHRAILLEDGSVTKCSSYSSDWNFSRFDPWELPSCLISAKDLKDILLSGPIGRKVARIWFPKQKQLPSELKYSLGLETFSAGFEDFKTLSLEHDGPLPDDRPLVFMKREENGDEVSEQRWLLNNDCLVMDCEWKNGEVTIRKGNPKKFPLALTKGLVREFLQGKWRNVDYDKKQRTFFLNFASFRSCLDQFKTLPHTHSGPLPEDRPLIFEKPAIKHECNKPLLDICNCTDFWSLCAGDIIVCGSWSENGEQKMTFLPNVNGNDVPAVLKTKDFLKYLVEKKWNVEKGWKLSWYGERRDFLAYFRALRLPKMGKCDPLPKTRPVAVQLPMKRWLLREDETLIYCHWQGSYSDIFVSPTDDVPHCMRHLCNESDDD